MVLFRHCKEKHADLKGMGGQYVSGRWNHKGTRIIYTSENKSLAILENLVHINARSFLPDDHVILSIRLNDDINFEHIDDNAQDAVAIFLDTKFLEKHVGKTWQNHPDFTRNIMQQYLHATNHIAIKVPSAFVPGEHNILLNPLYNHFNNKCKIIGKELFRFDSRLLPGA